ncbi:MAG: TetR/AcrR family transcriptional regulator [Clostridia bacterium]|nr:TetR/AcrR family transcriptional regulator [Clostridia bacterium]
MNRFESKYFNTALLFDEALLILLQKKDFEFISVKEVCEKAGVNRSTFYLHYENTKDLLQECVDMVNKKFKDSFGGNLNDKIKINSNNLEDLVFINSQFLIPYLEFTKENKLLFKAYYKHPELFNVKNIYSKMFENVFNPILEKFGFSKEDNEYIMAYYINGISAIIIKWVENNCKESIEKIQSIIMNCVRPYDNERIGKK